MGGSVDCLRYVAWLHVPEYHENRQTTGRPGSIQNNKNNNTYTQETHPCDATPITSKRRHCCWTISFYTPRFHVTNTHKKTTKTTTIAHDTVTRVERRVVPAAGKTTSPSHKQLHSPRRSMTKNLERANAKYRGGTLYPVTQSKKTLARRAL